jgi:hypothetical protein
LSDTAVAGCSAKKSSISSTIMQCSQGVYPVFRHKPAGCSTRRLALNDHHEDVWGCGSHAFGATPSEHRIVGRKRGTTEARRKTHRKQGNMVEVGATVARGAFTHYMWLRFNGYPKYYPEKY